MKARFATQIVNAITKAKGNPYWVIAVIVSTAFAALLSLPDQFAALHSNLGKLIPAYAEYNENRRKRSILCKQENTVISNYCSDTGNTWNDWITITGSPIEIVSFESHNGILPTMTILGIEEGSVIFEHEVLQCFVGCKARAKIIRNTIYVLVTAPTGGSGGGIDLAGFRVTTLRTLRKLPFQLLKEKSAYSHVKNGKREIVFDDVVYVIEESWNDLTDSSFDELPSGLWAVQLSDAGKPCEELDNGKCVTPVSVYGVRPSKGAMLLVPMSPTSMEELAPSNIE